MKCQISTVKQVREIIVLLRIGKKTVKTPNKYIKYSDRIDQKKM